MLFCNIADVLWHMLRIYFILVSAWILTGRRIWSHTHSVLITRAFSVLFSIVITVITSTIFCLFLPLPINVLQDLVPQACEGWWLVAVRGKQLSIFSSDTDAKWHVYVRYWGSCCFPREQIESPSTHGGRGFVTGRMFNRQGEVCTHCFGALDFCFCTHCWFPNNL